MQMMKTIVSDFEIKIGKSLKSKLIIFNECSSDHLLSVYVKILFKIPVNFVKIHSWKQAFQRDKN